MTTRLPVLPVEAKSGTVDAARWPAPADRQEFRRFSLKPSLKRIRQSRSLETKVILAVAFAIEGGVLPCTAMLCRKLRLRLVRFPTFAFGHLILEPDLFIKERLLGLRGSIRCVWIRDRQGIANRALLRLWKRQIPSIRLPGIDLSARPFRAFLEHPDIFIDTRPYIATVDDTGRFGDLQRRWGARPPVLQLPPEWAREGYAFLNRQGFPKGGWFACIHCREGGYHRRSSDQNFRNARIDTYSSAIRYIVEQGGWVVRVGDPTMEPLPKIDHVIDFAHSPMRGDRLDLFFGAECRFFLGGCSGPASLAAAFGRPMGMANCVPYSSVTFYCHNGLGLGMPKLLRSLDDGRILNFSEILRSEIANYRYQSLFDGARLGLVDNDEEDIRNLAQELLAMANGGFSQSEADRALQSRVKAMLRPGHYGYGSDCLFSPTFLRKHLDLVAGDPVS